MRRAKDQRAMGWCGQVPSSRLAHCPQELQKTVKEELYFFELRSKPAQALRRLGYLVSESEVRGQALPVCHGKHRRPVSNPTFNDKRHNKSDRGRSSK
jgi:hypothetical protein